MITLTGLYVYPVKSARGIALDTGNLTERGLEHDRRFMIVDREGQFLTQRELPQMARLETAFSDYGLALTWQGLGTEYVPLKPTAGPMRLVRVWNDDVAAIELGDACKRFLSAALGVSATLVYMPDTTARLPPQLYAGALDRVGFADGFPYLLANEGSLSDLNTRSERAITMDRFRPNLVVAGAEAYAEDTWREVAIGQARFELVKPCTRCVITTTDQATGERLGPEPLRSLAQYRLWRGEAAFAQNAIARQLGTLRLGDTVRVDSLGSVT